MHNSPVLFSLYTQVVQGINIYCSRRKRAGETGAGRHTPWHSRDVMSRKVPRVITNIYPYAYNVFISAGTYRSPSMLLAQQVSCFKVLGKQSSSGLGQVEPSTLFLASTCHHTRYGRVYPSSVATVAGRSPHSLHVRSKDCNLLSASGV